VDAGVLGLPEAARGGQHVVLRALPARDGKAGDASGERHRPDPPPGELVEVVGRDRVLRSILGVVHCAEKADQNQQRYEEELPQ
jgi:hypothetical protein